MKDFKPPPVSRKERKLRKMVKQILQWGWPDAEIEELIETTHKIEVRRMGEIFERAFGGKRNIENN
jgi:biotin synthase-related radical SAM superfamily protein